MLMMVVVTVDADDGWWWLQDDDDDDNDDYDNLLFVCRWQTHLENQLVFLCGFVRNINWQIPCVQIHPS